ncbi:MAG TPA: hemerythrin domain-containing protein [Candidatus Sulfotelmatobacter sp.]|nr:hemerythrin domain-containing protein [Candidatus Sulfotelmatobacter sp.]
MLRDKSLIPLSRQHQHALALCVRIERAMPIDNSKLAGWQLEIAQQFETEIKVHFAAEEQILFPVARAFGELNPLIEDLLADHQWLRACFARAEARQSSPEELLAFARRLSDHVRKEERQLFERLQKLMPPAELATLGQQLDRALESASQACSLPNPMK